MAGPAQRLLKCCKGARQCNWKGGYSLRGRRRQCLKARFWRWRTFLGLHGGCLGIARVTEEEAAVGRQLRGCCKGG